jgi:predicted SAM-dependent methyltransferase
MKALLHSYFKNLKIAASFLLKKKRKFNVGSGGINNDSSWYSSDISVLDITKDADWRTLLLFMKVDNIMAEHVWEHLTDTDTDMANKNCFKYLKKNGVMRLAVPDGYNPDKKYIDYVKPGGNGAGADDHKILYNYKIMKQRLEEVGFKVDLLEYWDESGNFHYTDWTDEGGRIERSRRYDDRNKNGVLGYTSLIVDAIKI